LTTKNSEYGKRRNRARRTLLKTVGNCPGDYRSSARSRRQSLDGNAGLARRLRPCGLSEDNRIHYGQRRSSSAFRDAHVTPLRLSSSSELRRCSSSASWALVKGSCSCSRLSQSCAMSARRSGGVKRTISSGVSGSVLSSLRNRWPGGKARKSLRLWPGVLLFSHVAQRTLFATLILPLGRVSQRAFIAIESGVIQLGVMKPGPPTRSS
jgi:hypothetical protein